jgi:ATP-dependent helicase/nuclease subunit A
MTDTEQVLNAQAVGVDDAGAAYAHSGRRVSQAAFYGVACDPRRSVVVEACAGAGKTWMLVSRMLRALLEGAQPHELLAITFTKKAAGEMRQRLYAWVEEFSHASDAQLEQALRDRGLGPDIKAEQMARLRGLHHLLLKADRPVQVRTFHGWFATLVRNAPVGELMRWGLPVQYELLEDDSRAVSQLWRRFHRRVAQDPLARQDYEDAVAVYGRHQTLKALEAALAKRVEFALSDAQGVVDASVQTVAQRFAWMAPYQEPLEVLNGEIAKTVLGAAARALGAASQKTYAARGVQLQEALQRSDIDQIFDSLLTKVDGPRAFGDKLSGLSDIQAAQDLLLDIRRAQLQHRAWLHQQRMARLTRGLLQDYAALKRERSWLDMNDLELTAQRLLSDPRSGAWIGERLDAQVRHLLVDEFQDTNPLQWKTLEAWIGSYAGAARAPSIFIVGDPKQSIYRFRRAEPQVFQDAKLFVVEQLGGDSLSCDHTRRNAQGVVQLVNTVFTPLAVDGGFEGFRAHTTASASIGCVLKLPQVLKDSRASDAGPQEDQDSQWRDSLCMPRHSPEDQRKVQEARQAARWLAHSLAGGAGPEMGPRRAADVMVLARKRERLALFRQELDALRIPAQFAEKVELSELPVVQDLLALVDALVSPRHDVSLAQALKSPLFGLDDAVLVQWVQHLHSSGADRSQGWLAALLSDTPLSPELAQVFAPVIDKLRHWQSLLLQLPPHDALSAIYREADVLAAYTATVSPAQATSVQMHLQALLGAALAVDGGRFLTAYGFVRALRAGGYSVPQVAAPHAVQLLTVHGAKGLEAPWVVMLDCDSESPKPPTMGVLVQWPGRDDFPRRFVFLASESKPPPCCEDLLSQEQIARRREEHNALYVAITRAKQGLVFSSMQPHHDNAHSWWKQLQAHSQEARHLPEVMDASPSAESGWADGQVHDLPLLPMALRGIAEPASAPVPPDADADLDARIGQAMHCLLEHYAPGRDDAGGLWSATAWHLAQTQFALDEMHMARAAQGAQAIVQGEGAWAWDAKLLQWQGNEISIYHGGRKLRIDRLVQRSDTGHWWVLDYKSAAQPQRDPVLCSQLATYCAAVRLAYLGQTVRAAFLSATGHCIEPLLPEEKP